MGNWETKKTGINHFILDLDLDIFFFFQHMTELWKNPEMDPVEFPTKQV